MKHRIRLILLSMSLVMHAACMHAYKQSVGGDTNQPYSRIYLTDLNTAWQSIIDALKNIRLDVTNREAGFIQTKWIDNTADKNSAESFGQADSYLKAQFRFQVNVSKGFYNGRPTVKVAVLKDQVVLHDVLESFRHIETDGIEENTLLYRIGYLIHIKMQIARLEEERTKRELKEAGF